jgi:hypothetical protein
VFNFVFYFPQSARPASENELKSLTPTLSKGHSRQFSDNILIFNQQEMFSGISPESTS